MKLPLKLVTASSAVAVIVAIPLAAHAAGDEPSPASSTAPSAPSTSPTCPLDTDSGTASDDATAGWADSVSPDQPSDTRSIEVPQAPADQTDSSSVALTASPTDPASAPTAAPTSANSTPGTDGTKTVTQTVTVTVTMPAESTDTGDDSESLSPCDQDRVDAEENESTDGAAADLSATETRVPATR